MQKTMESPCGFWQSFVHAIFGAPTARVSLCEGIRVVVRGGAKLYFVSDCICFMRARICPSFWVRSFFSRLARISLPKWRSMAR